MPTYSDLDLSFTSHPFTNDVLYKLEVNAVKQSLLNIFLTNKFEKPFEPEFGLGFNRILFENFDSIKKNILIKNIQNMVGYYEPRAAIEDINVNYDYDNNALIVTTYFYVRGNQNIQTLELSFERVR